jgi:hypothetical protein
MSDISYETTYDGEWKNLRIDVPFPRGLFIQLQKTDLWVGTLGKVASGIFLENFLESAESTFVKTQEQGLDLSRITRTVKAPVKREPLVLKVEPGQTYARTTNTLGDKEPEVTNDVARPITLEGLEEEGHDVTSIGLLEYECPRFVLQYMPEDAQASAGFYPADSESHPVFDFLASMHAPTMTGASSELSRIILGEVSRIA